MNDQSKKDQQVETTGHSWDGIEELNNPLPKWWLYIFYGTVIFGIVWTILYPAWPLVNRATQGILGYDSRAVVGEEIAKWNAQNAALDEKLISAGYAEIVADPELKKYAEQGGKAIFATYCSQCHGAGAAGNKGYPNLLDNDWLWGGTFADIEFTIAHGIRDEAAPDTRSSEMTPFQGIFSNEELDQLIAYVQSLSGQQVEGEMAAAGKPIFDENCTSCHLEGGVGDRETGAPNLSDAIWLYGGDKATIRETILNGRKGVMPHWSDKFTPSQIKQVVTYVHQLGGGEN